MRTVIGEILPLVIVVAISPVNIVAAILLLFSKRPILNASCYLAGFFVGVAAVLVATTAIARVASLSTDPQHSREASGLLLILGLALLVVAVRKFRGRPGPGEESPLPKWMDGIAGFGAGKSLVTGIAIGAGNPKNIVVAVAAGITIATGGLSTGQVVAVVAIYAVIASVGVATPIIAMLSLGDRGGEVLAGWQDWLAQNNAAMMAVIYLIFGVILLGKGIGGV